MPAGSTLNDYAITGSTTAQPSFYPDLEGEYTLTLEVDDGADTDSDTVIITVEASDTGDTGNPQHTGDTGNPQHTGDTGDTGGSASAYDGTWTGDVDISFQVTGYGTDTCEGVGTLSMGIQESGSPMINGNGTCTWQGAFIALFGSGDQNLYLTGDFSGTAISGEFTFGFLTDSWTGTFTSTNSLEGSASGSGTYMGSAYTYTAILTATK